MEFYVKANLQRHVLIHSTTKSNRDQRKNYGVRINPDISEWDEGVLMKNFDKLLHEHVTVNLIGEKSVFYYTCKLCDRKYKDITTATQHICQDHMKYMYDMEKKTTKEMRLAHNWNVAFNNKLGCHYCKKIFSQKFGDAGLYQHLQRVHKRIWCDECNSILMERNFHAHYLEHHRAGSKNDSLTLNAKLHKFLNEKTVKVSNEIRNLYSCRICGKYS